MATYTGSSTVSGGPALAFLLGTQTADPGPSQKSGPYKVDVTIDFTQYFGTNTSAGASSADVLSLINIPKGTIVHAVGAEVLTVTAGSGTISVGDTATSATAYINAQAPTSTGYVTVSKTNWPTLYTAVDIIKATINTASIADAKVRFFAIVSNVSKDSLAGPGGGAAWTP